MQKSIEQRINELKYAEQQHLQTHICACTREYCEQCLVFAQEIAKLEEQVELVAA